MPTCGNTNAIRTDCASPPACPAHTILPSKVLVLHASAFESASLRVIAASLCDKETGGGSELRPGTNQTVPQNHFSRWTSPPWEPAGQAICRCSGFRTREIRILPGNRKRKTGFAGIPVRTVSTLDHRFPMQKSGRCRSSPAAFSSVGIDSAEGSGNRARKRRDVPNLSDCHQCFCDARSSRGRGPMGPNRQARATI